MFLVDSNVWISLAISQHVFHQVSTSWFGRVASSDKLFFCRSTQQSLMRLLTTQSMFAPYGSSPMTDNEAWSAYENFRTDRRVTLMAEPSGLDLQWKKWSRGDRSSPKLWMDSYLAAFAFVGGCRLVTTDNGFNQFKGLDLLILS